MSEIRLAIGLIISLIIVVEQFDFLLMYTGILSGFYIAGMCLCLD